MQKYNGHDHLIRFHIKKTFVKLTKLFETQLSKNKKWIKFLHKTGLVKNKDTNQDCFQLVLIRNAENTVPIVLI